MNNKIVEGKRYSFFELFGDINYEIEIPVIQRDYAQGRTGRKETRELFLEALFNYLDEGIPFRDLDFVYGTTENGKFIPLDGQQRLTTLFLLHWYLAINSGEFESFRQKLSDNGVSKFNYKTRISSSEFCNCLIENQIDLSKLLVSRTGENESLAETICNKSWFMYEWRHDPTVQSMLVMLDAIHVRFFSTPSFYYKLVDETNPIITFIYLDLIDLQLTEDLYIKMNSRGKPLTIFENFKAKFEQKIDELFENAPFAYSLEFEGAMKPVPHREYFSFKIDTIWANLFWHYRHLIGDKNTYDDELMNFISLVLSYDFIVENSELAQLNLLLKSETLDEEGENISFNKISNIGALTVSSVSLLFNSFDVLYNGNNKLKRFFASDFQFDEDKFFSKALTNNLTLPERVLFYGYIQYLINYRTRDENFYEWMRVLGNLVENSRIEETDSMVQAIISVKRIIPKAGNILEYLTSKSCKIDFFYSKQVFEEILKAKLIQRGNGWEESIKRIERDIFHNGQIGYLLEFSGIIDYFNTLSGEIDNDAEKNLIKALTMYASKSKSLFETTLPDYLLERGVLTKGNYLVPASNFRLNFSSVNTVSNYQRDYSWKRILRLPASGDAMEDLWNEKRHFIKKLLDDKRFDKSNVENSLRHVILDTVGDWRNYFIQNQHLIGYCGQGFIYNWENRDIQLFNASQMNHLHIDMRLYDLYTRFFDQDKEIDPFEYKDYESVKGIEDSALFYLTEWCFQAKNYEINVFFDYDEDECFEVVFKKSKGDRNLIQYNKLIVEVLHESNFSWNEEIKVFQLQSADEKKVYGIIEAMRIRFKSICKS